MIEQHEYCLLNDYLEQDWDAFISFAETQGFDASEVYQLLNKLEEKANG
ncbi:TPA: hypothetical protein WGQ89_000355 [Neisseria meningitidis]|nr:MULTISPECIES: hypothetical protein [Neisseria]